jgi:hypothetical protein
MALDLVRVRALLPFVIAICFPCKTVFQTCRPRPPLRITKIVDRAVGEVGACQSATNASYDI